MAVINYNYSCWHCRVIYHPCTAIFCHLVILQTLFKQYLAISSKYIKCTCKLSYWSHEWHDFYIIIILFYQWLDLHNVCPGLHMCSLAKLYNHVMRKCVPGCIVPLCYNTGNSWKHCKVVVLTHTNLEWCLYNGTFSHSILYTVLITVKATDCWKKHYKKMHLWNNLFR